MTREEYLKLQQSMKHKSSHNGIAFLVISIFITLTVVALYFGATSSGLVWFISQIFLGVLVLQWFFLLHDLGHNHYFSVKPLNAIFGHLASLVVILPFYPWRYIHRTHHLWTGWKDKDPTMTIIIPREFPEWKKNLINFCWKFWIPIFTLSFSFANFWNYGKLSRMFPEKKLKNIFSIIFPVIIHVGIINYFGFKSYLSTWGLGYLFFLLLSDPLLLSQHTSVPQMHTGGKDVTMVPFWEQDTFTRSLVFPGWARKFIFLGFESHILHHLFPTLPGYHLSVIEHNSPNDIPWFEWLVEAKKTKGFELIISKELNIKE